LHDLRKHFSEEQIAELVLTISVANFTNRVNESMQSDPDLGD
jgi:alkylhydroperoxidase family enzyme